MLGHLGHLLEWYAPAIGRAYGDIGDVFHIFAVLRQEADYDVKATLPVKHLGDSLSSNGSLHRTVYVAWQYAVTRRSFAVYADKQIGLPQLANDAQIGYAVHSRHDFGDLACSRFKFFQIVAK